MSTTIKTGWLNDKQGNKFAPRTLTSQVQTSDGLLLEDIIVKTTAQTLTDEQKVQARENIGALSAEHEYSWEDLNNRPFDELTEYTKVKEHTINCSEFKNNGYYGRESVSGDDYLAYSENVSFDSVMYYNINMVDGYTGVYGNGYLYDSSKEDNGLPFCFIVKVDESINPVSIDIYAKTQGEHTIALYRESSTVQTLDEKFIPDTIARTSDVDAAIAGLVDTAPDTLNTLNELAAALGDDPNFATTVLEQVGNKVEKVDGMGLSSNDYTSADKAKVNNAENIGNKITEISATSTDEQYPSAKATHNAIKSKSSVTIKSWTETWT